MSNNSLRKFALKKSTLNDEVKSLKIIDNNREIQKLQDQIEKMKKDIKNLKEKMKKMNTVKKGRFTITDKSKSN